MHKRLRVPAETGLPDRALSAQCGLAGTFGTPSDPRPTRDQTRGLHAESVLAALGPFIDLAPVSLEQDTHLAFVADEAGTCVDTVIGVVELATRVFPAVDIAANAEACRRAGEPHEPRQRSMDLCSQSTDHADAALRARLVV